LRCRIKAFGVVQKPNGMASRECFLIKEGKIVWHDPSASTDKQAADIAAVLAELK
jgi:peroxiredoxin Q/BCP